MASPLTTKKRSHDEMCGPLHVQTDAQTDAQTDVPMHGQTDRQTDDASKIVTVLTPVSTLPCFQCTPLASISIFCTPMFSPPVQGTDASLLSQLNQLKSELDTFMRAEELRLKSEDEQDAKLKVDLTEWYGLMDEGVELSYKLLRWSPDFDEYPTYQLCRKRGSVIQKLCLLEAEWCSETSTKRWKVLNIEHPDEPPFFESDFDLRKHCFTCDHYERTTHERVQKMQKFFKPNTLYRIKYSRNINEVELAKLWHDTTQFLAQKLKDVTLCDDAKTSLYLHLMRRMDYARLGWRKGLVLRGYLQPMHRMRRELQRDDDALTFLDADVIQLRHLGACTRGIHRSTAKGEEFKKIKPKLIEEVVSETVRYRVL